MGWFTNNKKDPAPEPAKAEEEYAVMPKELRIAIASLKGRVAVPDDRVVKVPMAEVFPVTAAIQKEERTREAARQQAEAEALKNPQIGKLMVGKGIFIGQEERDGHNYNWFVLPTDLIETSGEKILRTYNDTAKELASRKNMYGGHDGADCKNEEGLYKGFENGSLLGKWIMPPRHIVQGKDVDGNDVRPDNNLYALRNTEDFKGTFTTASGDGTAHWYWSCTEHRDNSGYVYGVDFTDGGVGWNRKDGYRLSSRPCRVELVI